MSLGYWVINSAGIGGMVVTVVFLSLLIVYAKVLRWICGSSQREGEANARP